MLCGVEPRGADHLIARGTEAQKRHHLPMILRGDEIWCQGFSEPNAGSDLASLKTHARVDEDHLVVNGSKIWTSHGHLSDWQELLVRTNIEAPKHKGISWVICDMKTPGITLRPIQIMTSPNQVHFVQCFYDDVRIPFHNVVGGLNDGWNVAMSTLGFERGTAQIRDQIRYAFLVEKMIRKARDRTGIRCRPVAGRDRCAARAAEGGHGRCTRNDLHGRVARGSRDSGLPKFSHARHGGRDPAAGPSAWRSTSSARTRWKIRRNDDWVYFLPSVILHHDRGRYGANPAQHHRRACAWLAALRTE